MIFYLVLVNLLFKMTIQGALKYFIVYNILYYIVYSIIYCDTLYNQKK